MNFKERDDVAVGEWYVLKSNIGTDGHYVIRKMSDIDREYDFITVYSQEEARCLSEHLTKTGYVGVNR